MEQVRPSPIAKVPPRLSARICAVEAGASRVKAYMRQI